MLCCVVLCCGVVCGRPGRYLGPERIVQLQQPRHVANAAILRRARAADVTRAADWASSHWLRSHSNRGMTDARTRVTSAPRRSEARNTARGGGGGGGGGEGEADSGGGGSGGSVPGLTTLHQGRDPASTCSTRSWSWPVRSLRVPSAQCVCFRKTTRVS